MNNEQTEPTVPTNNPELADSIKNESKQIAEIHARRALAGMDRLSDDEAKARLIITNTKQEKETEK